jgi:hypothetical protein
MVTTQKKEATTPDTEQSAPAPVTSIQKPAGFSLDRFKSKRAASVAGLDNLVDGMPHFPVGHQNPAARREHRLSAGDRARKITMLT